MTLDGRAAMVLPITSAAMTRNKQYLYDQESNSKKQQSVYISRNDILCRKNNRIPISVIFHYSFFL